MTLHPQAVFWGLILLGFAALLYLFKAILTPFILALAIAYFLEPVMKRMSRIGLGRGVSALLILALFFTVVLALGLAILPPAYHEMTAFFDDLPGYIERGERLLRPVAAKLEALGAQAGMEMSAGNAGDFFLQNAGTAANVGKTLAQSLLAGGQAFATGVSFLLITPIVAYFMMKQWIVITDWIEELMPREHKNTIMDLLGQIDSKIAGFVRDQLSVAVILGVSYAVILSLLGLKYGFLIGLVAGFLNIIPFLGSSVGLLTSVGVAWFQSSDWVFVLTIAGVFLAGQFIEGNFLTPRLVGHSVGLHPLWVFFALMAGGALFGVAGMLLAVPVAAVIGVLGAFAISRYKQSGFYKGDNAATDRTPARKKKGRKNG